MSSTILGRATHQSPLPQSYPIEKAIDPLEEVIDGIHQANEKGIWVELDPFMFAQDCLAKEPYACHMMALVHYNSLRETLSHTPLIDNEFGCEQQSKNLIFNLWTFYTQAEVQRQAMGEYLILARASKEEGHHLVQLMRLEQEYNKAGYLPKGILHAEQAFKVLYGPDGKCGTIK